MGNGVDGFLWGCEGSGLVVNWRGGRDGSKGLTVVVKGQLVWGWLEVMV